MDEERVIIDGLRGAAKGRQHSIAAELGMNQGHLSRFLSGKTNTTLKRVCQIARAAETSLAEILGAGSHPKQQRSERELSMDQGTVDLINRLVSMVEERDREIARLQSEIRRLQETRRTVTEERKAG